MDWVPLTDLLNLLTADSDASVTVGDCIAAGWLEFDSELDVVRTSWRGRAAAGLPACVFPAITDAQAAVLTRKQRLALLRRTAWFKRG
jgi:hypothetical protein